MRQSEALALRADEFETWLKGVRPHVYVGNRRDAAGCPLAQWLRETVQPAPVFIRVYANEIAMDDVFYRAPEWMVEFRARIDADNMEPYHPPVAQSDALAALQNIMADLRR